MSERIADTAAERSFWLTQGMAKMVGVSLTDAMAVGALAREDFADMVVRCGACEFSERCVRWMAEGGPGDGDPPGYCLNHEVIEALHAAVSDDRR
jgi:hypothetical protein